jgi:TPR repeat protein
MKNNLVDVQPANAAAASPSPAGALVRHGRAEAWPTFAACERAAKIGDPDAEAQLGFMYQAGAGVQASPEKALHWYQLAASSGQLRAKVNMGVMYAWGMGIARDDAMAAQLFREAADKGDGTAASYLGDLYFFGRGVPKDVAQAEQWYTRGIKLHDPLSAYNLAILKTGQFGHAPDLNKAVSLLKKSADAGYVPAMHELGLLYVRNPQFGDAAAAKQLLEAASAAGNWRSTIVLALLNRDGKFVQANPRRAYYYFRLSALQGGDKARQLVAADTRRLEKLLAVDEASAEGAQADAWHRDHSQTLAFIPNKGNAWTVYAAPMLAGASEDSHPQQPAAIPPA